MQDSYLKGLYSMLMKKYNKEDIEWQDIAEFIGEYQGTIPHRDTCRRQSKYLFDLMDGGYKLEPPNDGEEFVKDNVSDVYDAENNTHTYSRLIEIDKSTETITPELIMQKHNIDPGKWKVVSYKNNYWSSQAKGGKIITLFQSKVTVKPIDKTEIGYSDIDEYFAKKHFSSRPAIEPFVYDDSQESLEIDFADSHIGLLSWAGETGTDYDIRIAEKRFKQIFMDIIERSKGKKYKLINFVTLGDILHVDTMSNTTTKGTVQDADGRITKIFDIAVDLICDCIDILLQLKCPIRYTYTSGNHDTFSGYALAKCVEKVYEKNPNITFDISPNPQKIFVYGNTLVGYVHGDMNRKNLGEWLQKGHREEFGKCKFAEVHCGHLHSESVKENCGVLIKHLPTICESSLWEHKEGYNSQKGVMCFVYHDTMGLRNTWYNYL